VAQASAALERARLDLGDATLHAPFDGPVLAVGASPGNFTTLGQTLVEIADADGLEVRAPVPDSYARAVRDHLHRTVPIRARAQLDNHEITLRCRASATSGAAAPRRVLSCRNGSNRAAEIGRILNT
jgi:multidrug efflux pump subunit AcrA (membrane-fusion protein)